MLVLCLVYGVLRRENYPPVQPGGIKNSFSDNKNGELYASRKNLPIYKISKNNSKGPAAALLK